MKLHERRAFPLISAFLISLLLAFSFFNVLNSPILFGPNTVYAEDTSAPIFLLPLKEKSTAQSQEPALPHLVKVQNAEKGTAEKSEDPIEEPTTRLKTMRGGRHEDYCSIVLEFEDEIKFDEPVVEGNQIVLAVKNVVTGLAPYREYETFDSWVRLDKRDKNLQVRAGIPQNFQIPHVFLMEKPHRVVINFHEQEVATTDQAGKKDLHPEETVISATDPASTPKHNLHPYPIIDEVSAKPIKKGKDSEIPKTKEAPEKRKPKNELKEVPAPLNRAAPKKESAMVKTIAEPDSETLASGEENSTEHKTPPEKKEEVATQGTIQDNKEKETGPTAMTTAGAGSGPFVPGVPFDASGEYRIEISPRISISEEYDDNVLSEKENKTADYKTTLSPGIKLDMESGKNGLALDYEFGWVKYHKRTQNDYINHNGTLQLWQQIARHLTFRLDDAYTKSDDILAATNQGPVSQRVIPGVLQKYQRNTATAALEYQFGPKDLVGAGYIYNILDNEDPELQDTTEYGPFLNLAYWLDNRDGLEFDYFFTRYDYDQKNGTIETRPDLDSHDILGRYLHVFSSRASANIQYGLFIRDFSDVSVNYQIHDFQAGFDYGFSPNTSFSFEAGYFRATGDANIDPGLDLSARLTKKFRRGSMSLGVQRGWDTGYNEVVPRGFTRFWSTDVGIKYQLLEKLNATAGITYRKNRYGSDELDILGGEPLADDETYRGRCGISWQFYRWFSANLNYTYYKQLSDDPNNEFDDNRVMLTIRASKPFKY